MEAHQKALFADQADQSARQIEKEGKNQRQKEDEELIVRIEEIGAVNALRSKERR